MDYGTCRSSFLPHQRLYNAYTPCLFVSSTSSVPAIHSTVQCPPPFRLSRPHGECTLLVGGCRLSTDHEPSTRSYNLEPEQVTELEPPSLLVIKGASLSEVHDSNARSSLQMQYRPAGADEDVQVILASFFKNRVRRYLLSFD